MSGEVEENFSISQDGMLTMKGRVCVLDVEELRKMIMKKLTTRHTQRIQVVLKCIVPSKKIIGGRA